MYAPVLSPEFLSEMSVASRSTGYVFVSPAYIKKVHKAIKIFLFCIMNLVPRQKGLALCGMFWSQIITFKNHLVRHCWIPWKMIGVAVVFYQDICDWKEEIRALQSTVKTKLSVATKGL